MITQIVSVCVCGIVGVLFLSETIYAIHSCCPVTGMKYKHIQISFSLPSTDVC